MGINKELNQLCQQLEVANEQKKNDKNKKTLSNQRYSGFYKLNF